MDRNSRIKDYLDYLRLSDEMEDYRKIKRKTTETLILSNEVITKVTEEEIDFS